MNIRNKDQIRTVIGKTGKSFEQTLYVGAGVITVAARDIDELRFIVDEIEGRDDRRRT